jgi:hypothetical protein
VTAVSNAFGLEPVAQSSLLPAGLFICWITRPRKATGVVLAERQTTSQTPAVSALLG